MQWDNQWLRDYRVREPVIFAVAFCVADEVLSSSGQSMGFQKANFIYVIIIIDFVVVFLMICFINFIERRYIEYSELFDKRNVEMKDFTIEVGNIPKDFRYGGKQLQLQALLWIHFERHVKDAMEK